MALLVREGTLIVDALERLRDAMPFPLRGFDTDNGSEFINETVVAYCRERNIEFTRSRPYRKNDQAWIEQKNGSIVRRLVGYGRLEGIAAADTLSRMYCAARLFVNFFQPSFKLAEKRRVGARVSKRYHTPETPCARLLASDAVSEATKGRLRDVAMTLDPLKLLDEIRSAQARLGRARAGGAARECTCRRWPTCAFLAPNPPRSADADGTILRLRPSDSRRSVRDRDVEARTHQRSVRQVSAGAGTGWHSSSFSAGYWARSGSCFEPAHDASSWHSSGSGADRGLRGQGRG